MNMKRMLAACVMMLFNPALGRAQSDPDKMVHCHINLTSQWVKLHFCEALVAEAKIAVTNSRTEDKLAVIQQCAANLAEKFPGDERASHLNACEALVAALGLE
jgi:hypothetical protein